MAVLGAVFIGVGVHILLYFLDAVNAVIMGVSYLFLQLRKNKLWNGLAF